MDYLDGDTCSNGSWTQAMDRHHRDENDGLSLTVMSQKHPTMLYTDHMALESIMRVGTDAHGRIVCWMDRLTEYDYIIKRRPGT